MAALKESQGAECSAEENGQATASQRKSAPRQGQGARIELGVLMINCLP